MINYREIFNKIASKEITKFGLWDELDPKNPTYYPCKFIEVIDEKRMLIKIYEPALNKYYIEGVGNLVIDKMQK